MDKELNQKHNLQDPREGLGLPASASAEKCPRSHDGRHEYWGHEQGCHWCGRMPPPEVYEQFRQWAKGRGSEAAAQSHFDRTLAEKDAEIERLRKDMERCRAWAEIREERIIAAELRAAEAEKDALLNAVRWFKNNEVAVTPWIVMHLERMAQEATAPKPTAKLDALRAEGSGNG
jgi:hypothetical protein